jgi:hypothetical protein
MNGAQALKIKSTSTAAARNFPQTIDRGLSVEMNSRSTLVSERSAASRTPAYAGTSSRQTPRRMPCSVRKMACPAW